MSSMFAISSVLVLSLLFSRARSKSCTDCCDESGLVQRACVDRSICFMPVRRCRNRNPQVDFVQLTLQNVNGFCQVRSLWLHVQLYITCGNAVADEKV